LLDAAERNEDGRWRLKKGLGPARAIRRYSIAAPDDVRLLQCGKVGREGLPPIIGAVQAFYQVIHRLARTRVLRTWTLVGDLPAGPRQTAFDWAPYARTFVVLVEPTWKSALTARRIIRIARARGSVDALVVANKVSGRRELRRLERLVGEPVVFAIPVDEAVEAAERLGVALLDHAPASPAVRAIERLVDGLTAATVADVGSA
jgi:CO dehydrogenase maturation factor